MNSTTLKQLVIGRDADHNGGFILGRIYLDTFDNPIADTISYERTYDVIVELWQELTQKSKRNAELDLANALHLVLNRISGSWQLGIGVEGMEITSSPIQLAQLNGAPMLLARVRCRVLTLVQNPT